MQENDLDILKKVEDGSISVEEAEKILNKGFETASFEEEQFENGHQQNLQGNLEHRNRVKKCKNIWVISFTSMVFLTILFGVWIYSAFYPEGFRFGLIFPIFFFVLSALGMAFAWRLKYSRWIVFRLVRDPDLVTETRKWEFLLPGTMARGLLKTLKWMDEKQVEVDALVEFFESFQEEIHEYDPFVLEFDEKKHRYHIKIWSISI